jgi:hypothetical protein
LQIAQNTAMKKLFSLTFLGLIVGNIGLSSPVWAKNDMNENIHIDQSRQFPETRWANADHFIRVHVPHKAKALKILRLRVSENLRFAVSQVDGQNIPVTVTSQGHIVQIEFAKSIGKDTLFDIHIRNVAKISASRPAIYTLSAQLVNGGQYEFVGEAYFRSY